MLPLEVQMAIVVSYKYWKGRWKTFAGSNDSTNIIATMVNKTERAFRMAKRLKSSIKPSEKETRSFPSRLPKSRKRLRKLS